MDHPPKVQVLIDRLNMPTADADQRRLYAELEAWWSGLTLRERVATHLLMTLPDGGLEAITGPEGSSFRAAPDFILDLMMEKPPPGYEIITEGAETIVMNKHGLYRGDDAFARALDGDPPDEPAEG